MLSTSGTVTLLWLKTKINYSNPNRVSCPDMESFKVRLILKFQAKSISVFFTVNANLDNVTNR